MTLPADIGRVGGLGACILALIRYVTTPTDDGNGRTSVDGETWWCASQDDIGRLLGDLDRKAVGRALLKLEAARELLTRPADRFYGDRARAYRLADQPLPTTGQGSDQPLPTTGPPIARNRASSLPGTGPARGPEVGNLPIPKNLKEPSGGKKPRSRGTRLDPDWMPSKAVIAEMRLECPGVDLEAEYRKFIDYWCAVAGARALKISWERTWRNWIRNARPSSSHQQGRSTTDERIAQVQALKRPEDDNPPALEAGGGLR